jgi:hypothetical protein
MGTFSDYLENKWLTHTLKSTAFTKPTGLFLALSTTDPLDAGSGITEPVGNNYARKTCLANFTTASTTRSISNTTEITMNTASGSWGTITHWALFDAVTSGNMLCHGNFSTGKSVVNGQTPKVLAGELVISIPANNGMTTYLANAMLNHTFQSGGTSFTQPTNEYIGLGITSTFLDTGVFTNEVAASNNYARVLANSWTVTGNAAENTGALTFGVASGSWGTIAYWCLTDNATRGAGNMLLYGTWDTAFAIAGDDQANIAAGALDITQD